MIINCRNLLGHTTGVQRYTQRIIDEVKKKIIIKLLKLDQSRECRVLKVTCGSN
ncbi:mannosyltransferase [Klebsiella pneumoniae ISC21]|nr:mannosyltransferase [Klebsiella pneumoniae ISC21]